ncbi:MAG: polysaccharide biosynthesis protein, partial [Burkholderiales bacterium]
MNLRRLVVFLHDLAAVAAAWCVAFWLRFNLDIPPEFAAVMWHRLPIPLVLHGVLFWTLGLYRGLWRYASLPDLQRILVVAGVGALAVPAVLALLGLLSGVPRSVFLVAPMLLVGAMAGNRLAYRAWREGRLLAFVAKPRSVPVLVIGGGNAAAALLKELAASQDWRVVGLLDD